LKTPISFTNSKGLHCCHPCVEMESEHHLSRILLQPAHVALCWGHLQNQEKRNSLRSKKSDAGECKRSTGWSPVSSGSDDHSSKTGNLHELMQCLMTLLIC